MRTRTRWGAQIVLAAMLCTLAVTSARVETAHSQATSRPNVLIIITDDQRPTGTMKVMPKTRTWFKTGGTHFSRAFATTPTCCPSRASIFSGRYSHNHGVHTSERGQAENLDQSTTVQAHLSDAGYRTAIFGKFLNSWPKEDPPPYFDSWSVFSGRPALGYKGAEWNVDGEVKEIKRYSTTYVGDRAVKFLRDSEAVDDEPWLMYLTPFAPHKPSIPEKRYESAPVSIFDPNPATLEEDKRDKPQNIRNRRTTLEHVRDVRAAQLRSLMSVDDLVDRVMSELSADEEENTIAFFLSDNGYLWGDHGLMGKREPYAPSVGIPFYVRWPGVFGENAVDDRLVATIDIAPTIFDVGGVQPPLTIDGRSLLDEGRTRLLLEHWRRAERSTPDWAGMWTDDFEYVEHYLRDRLVVTFREYYDLAEDPWQLTNLFNDGDPNNDPDVFDTSFQLQRDIRCSGTSGAIPCP